jgi:predicted methyltransferase
MPPIRPENPVSRRDVLRTTLSLGVVVALAGRTAAAADAAPAPDPALAKIVADPTRAPPAVARDPFRRPVETLTFLGLKPTMTVVELWPGAGYWTEILGPYLRDHGRYIVAQPAGNQEEMAGVKRWRERVAGHGGSLGKIEETQLGPGHFDIAPPGSADLVLTVRNLHNWIGDGYADEVLAGCFRALKPGGILGVQDHRGRDDRPQDPKAASGYVRQDYAIALVKKAGFELVATSEINANPRDTKDWVDGVWTLPPTLSQKDKDREKYVAVGEADNFLLKFRKPKR